MRDLKKMFIIDTVLIGGIRFFPILQQTVAFVVFIAMGNSFTLAQTFAIVTVFNIMIDPIIGLPWMIGCMVEFIVSMKRI